jgi:predicted nucleotidyltransferase
MAVTKSPPSLLEEDATLRRIVDTIVDGVDPEQVILFGSRARGDATAHSDYDICVIVRDTENRRDLIREVHRLFDVRGFSMDVLVLTPDELEEQRDIANTLGFIVARDGEVLYERS